MCRFSTVLVDVLVDQVIKASPQLIVSSFCLDYYDYDNEYFLPVLRFLFVVGLHSDVFMSFDHSFQCHWSSKSSSSSLVVKTHVVDLFVRLELIPGSRASANRWLERKRRAPIPKTKFVMLFERSINTFTTVTISPLDHRWIRTFLIDIWRKTNGWINQQIRECRRRSSPLNEHRSWWVRTSHTSPEYCSWHSRFG